MHDPSPRKRICYSGAPLKLMNIKFLQLMMVDLLIKKLFC